MKKPNPTFNLALIEESKRMRFDPLRNFEPRQLTLALDLFRAGRLRDLALVIDAQEERDDTLAAVVPKAKASVARHGWEVCVIERVPDALKSAAEKQKEVLENFYNQLRVTNALDQDEIGSVSLLLRQMMDAKSKRYAVHNIVWRPGAMPTAELWFTPLWFFENSTGKMRFLAQPYAYDGEDMAPGEWLVTKGLGIGIACSVAWTFKHMSLRDWVLYNARAGRPGIEGITDATPGTPQWQNMVNAVAKAAADFRWVRNRTEEIKTIEFGTKGELPFAPLVERMDRAMAALWRGADLSTISAGQGRGQGASLQGEEADLIEQDDSQWLSETLNLKLDRLVLDYVFGEDAPALAYFKVLGTQADNTDRDLKVDEFLVDRGFPMSIAQAAERYSRPLPDGANEDELLRAPAKPAAPGLPGTPEPGAPALPAANEATDPNMVAFMARATAQAKRGEAAVLQPILRRLAAIEAMTDTAQQQAACRDFAAAWPQLRDQAIKRAPNLAATLAQIDGTAFVSGLVDAAKARKAAVSNP